VNWHWPLALVIVALIFFAYCAYSTREATRSVDHALDTFAQQACYQAGYNAGLSEHPPSPSEDSDECDRWFEMGLSDGRKTYKDYEELLD